MKVQFRFIYTTEAWYSISRFSHLAILFFALLCLSGCLGKNKIVVDLKNPKKKGALNITVSSIQVINHQIVITGTNLTTVNNFEVKEGAGSTNLQIESQTSTTIIANTISNVTFAAGKVFDFVFSSAQAASIYTVNFSLCDSNLGGKGFNCVITPNDKEVLSYNAVSGKWEPRPVNGISYKGAWDALNDPFPTATEAGEYYIVSVANAPYNVGDWAVFNGTGFDRIDNSQMITSVFGRTGAVVATEGDYNLTKLSDVTITAPATNQVLTYNGSAWVNGSATYTETDPTVTAFAKLALPVCGAGEVLKSDGTSFSCITDNAGAGAYSGTANRAVITDGAGTLSISSVTSTVLGYLGNVTSDVQSQINAKLNSSSFVDWSTTGIQTIDPSRINLTTANRVVVTNGSANPSVSTITATELGHLSGVSSNIQTQLNSKLSSETDPNVTAFAKAALPTCGAGQVLKADGTSFSCVTDDTGVGAYNGSANRLVLTDGSGALTTSLVTNTEATYLSGVTSNIQAQLNNKQISGKIITNQQDAGTINPFGTNTGETGEFRFYELVANGTNYTGFKAPDTMGANLIYTLPQTTPNAGEVLSSNASGVLSWIAIPSAPVTSVNTLTGAVTLTTTNINEGTNLYHTDARVLGTPITAPTLTNSAIVTSDSVQTSLGKLQAQINNKEGALSAGTATQYYRGDKSWQDLDTLAVPENTNLYFTDARARSAAVADSIADAVANMAPSQNAVFDALALKMNSASFIDWSVNGLQTIDPSRLNLGAPSGNKALVTDGSGFVVASGVTSTEIGYMSGVTSNVQTQIDAKQAMISKTTTQDVSKLRIYGANATNYVELSAATLTGNRSLIFPDSNGSAGDVLKTDGAGNLSWIAIPSAPVSSVNTLTGAVTLTTTNINEGTNLYHTDARVLGTAITAPTLTNSTIVTSDSVQTSLGKLQGQLNNILSLVLTGLSTATNAVISSTDTIIGAFGKLQAQISANTTSVASKADQTNVAQTITAATVTGLISPIAGSDATNKTYVDAQVAGASNAWSESGGNVYRSSGYVGIGTTSPTSLLHLNQAASNSLLMPLILQNNDATDTGGSATSIGFRVANTAAAKGAIAFERTGANGRGKLHFLLNNVSDTSTAAALSDAHMTIDNLGNVGIGTTTPGATLDINGTLKVAGGAPGLGKVLTSDATGLASWATPAYVSFPMLASPTGTAAAPAYSFNGSAGTGMYSASANTVSFSTAGTSRMIIDSTGNVVINGGGVSSMSGGQNYFSISGTGGDTALSSGLINVANNRATASVGDNLGEYRFISNSNNGFDGPAIVMKGLLEGAGGANGFGGAFTIGTKPNNVLNPAERFRIDSAGNVGIGTTTPSSALDVAGNITLSGLTTRILGDFSNATVANRSLFKSSTTNGVTSISAIPNGTGTTSNFAVANSSDPDNASWGTMTSTGTVVALTSTKLGTGTYLPLIFQVAGAERMRIDTLGNVGIGMTPTYPLEVNGVISATSAGVGYASLNAAGGIEVSKIGSTPYIDFKDANGDDYDTRIIQLSNGLAFHTGGNGVATQKVIIDTAGNVGIGLTTPTYQLQLSTDSAAKPGTSTWTIASDERLKDIRAPFLRGLDALKQINPVYFKYKENNPLNLPSDKEYVGIRAQDAKKAIPEAVETDALGFLHLKSDSIVWTILNAVKEFYVKWLDDSREIHRAIASDKVEIEKLKNENAKIKRDNYLMKTYLCGREQQAAFCK